MPSQTLYTAASGMEAMQLRLDVIANNLANANTVSFKRDRANTEDLFYRHLRLPGNQDASGQYSPTGLSIGLGSRVSGTQTDYMQGAFDPTNRQLDVAIEGDGFFQVIDPSTNQILYTRAGNFDKNADGNIVIASAGVGRLIDPPINIPQDATAIEISPDGIVSVLQPGNTQLQQVGTIQLARFINPDGLVKLGENLYSESISSGQAIIGNPGQQGLGRLQKGMLELSNVEPVRELIDLITTQRGFELSSQAVQAADQMLQLVTNLRRF